MKAEELRIGNWVYSQEIGENVKINTISSDNWLSFGIPTWDNPSFDEIHSIPLTEEILSKCPEITKCSYSTVTWRIRDPRSQFHIVKHNGRFVFRGLGMSVVYVDTLHHLQNLVYVNTLKELEVNI